MQSMSCTPPQQVQQINALPVQGTSSQKIMPAHTIIQPDQGPYSGQHFIVTITGEHGGEQENIQMAHGSAGQVVYQSPQSYASYNNQAGMYTAVTGAYDQAPGCTVQMSSGGIGGIQGQILTHGGESYLVQGNILEGEGQGLSHSIRASPASDPSGQRTSHFDVKCWQREVQWLMDNYETAEGVSLPRSTLYNHYLRHCQENKLEPMNPASFGKLIRSVFLGLRTRRLGTRGNSQYHYYGIRIKSTSRLNQMANDQFMFSRQNSMNSVKRFKASYDGRDSNSGSMLESSPASQTSLGVLTSHQQQHQQFLGDASAAMPEFGHIELSEDHLPHGITRKHLLVFEELYKDHCEAFLEVVVNLQFPFVEALWMSFWKNEHGDPGFEEMEQRLPKEKLYFMCELPAVQQYVLESDYAFYQALVQVLIPDVLRPIPGALTQSIRNFAKSLEGWLKNAMNGAPEEMIQTKVNAVSAFAQILRRYTSLNHLAQAARAVLQNGSQISQMLADINKVDFSNVQEQASWVCQCSDETVHQLQEDFKKTLEHQTSLEQWASWLEDVVSQALSPHESSPDFARAARQFLLKWSFYSSMVIRDLTLRSAASFGSFHLIRLLYDEYMFYLVEQKVAAATGETSIAVMGKVRQVQDSERVLLFDTPCNGDGISVYRQMDTVASDGQFSTGVLDVSLAKPLITVNLARSSVLASAPAQHPSASLFRVSAASDTSAFFLQQSAATTNSDSAQSSSVLVDSMNLSVSRAGTEPSGILVNRGLGLVKQ